MANTELQALIEFVKTNDKVQTLQQHVEEYFSQITWSLLKEEFEHMTESEKDSLYRKLFHERFGCQFYRPINQ